MANVTLDDVFNIVTNMQNNINTMQNNITTLSINMNNMQNIMIDMQKDINQLDQKIDVTKAELKDFVKKEIEEVRIEFNEKLENTKIELKDFVKQEIEEVKIELKDFVKKEISAANQILSGEIRGFDELLAPFTKETEHIVTFLKAKGYVSVCENDEDISYKV